MKDTSPGVAVRQMLPPWAQLLALRSARILGISAHTLAECVCAPRKKGCAQVCRCISHAPCWKLWKRSYTACLHTGSGAALHVPESLGLSMAKPTPQHKGLEDVHHEKNHAWISTEADPRCRPGSCRCTAAYPNLSSFCPSTLHSDLAVRFDSYGL